MCLGLRCSSAVGRCSCAGHHGEMPTSKDEEEEEEKRRQQDAAATSK